MPLEPTAGAPAEKEGDVWRCVCGFMTIVLPYKPPLLSICCLQPYIYVRPARKKHAALT